MKPEPAIPTNARPLYPLPLDEILGADRPVQPPSTRVVPLEFPNVALFGFVVQRSRYHSMPDASGPPAGIWLLANVPGAEPETRALYIPSNIRNPQGVLDDIARWQFAGHLVQNALPWLPLDAREVLMSGLTQHEWDATFAEDEEPEA